MNLTELADRIFEREWKDIEVLERELSEEKKEILPENNRMEL